MKLLFIGLISGFICYGQEPALDVFPLRDGAIHYERIITVDSASKDDLYLKAKSWAVNAFKSQKAALQAEDKELGFISFKSLLVLPFQYPPIIGVPSSPYDWEYSFIMKIFL